MPALTLSLRHGTSTALQLDLQSDPQSSPHTLQAHRPEPFGVHAGRQCQGQAGAVKEGPAAIGGGPESRHGVGHHQRLVLSEADLREAHLPPGLRHASRLHPTPWQFVIDVMMRSYAQFHTLVTKTALALLTG